MGARKTKTSKGAAAERGVSPGRLSQVHALGYTIVGAAKPGEQFERDLATSPTRKLLKHLDEIGCEQLSGDPPWLRLRIAHAKDEASCIWQLTAFDKQPLKGRQREEQTARAALRGTVIRQRDLVTAYVTYITDLQLRHPRVVEENSADYRMLTTILEAFGMPVPQAEITGV